ncbi:MAG: DUF2493 domain-containing protein [Methylorubrum rhodinum]|uniref:DUF2493 domain-containing protein n=1 Tax=Methylorubrum rhodinum TaxID=29428 RepID=UPI003BB1E8D9
MYEDFSSTAYGDSEPHPSQFDHITACGFRPFEAHDDPRPLPAPEAIEGALLGAMNAMADVFADTQIEDDAGDVLWSFVNIFHRRAEHIERKLDENEAEQRRSQGEQDGSEVKSVELERKIAIGIGLCERRNIFEFARDKAASLYGTITGSLWRPRSGSQVSHATMTAAMVDSRDFLNARRRLKAEILVPQGTLIAFTGGQDYQDVDRIWSLLDKVRAKHPDMVLIHGASPKGAELIAAKWADTRKVKQVAFRPDWKKHGKAAPFRRNDAMLEAMPVGIIHFPGGGISDNLADKARTKGIPVQRGVRAGA